MPMIQLQCRGSAAATLAPRRTGTSAWSGIHTGCRRSWLGQVLPMPRGLAHVPRAVPDDQQQPVSLRSNEFLQSLEEPLPATTAQAASDNVRAAGVVALTAILAFSTELNKGWIADHQELAMGAVFLLGYGGIIVEEALGLSKAGVALMMAAALWAIRFTEGPMVDVEITESLGEVSQVIFFLLGAMTVVEVVDAHQGFRIITSGLRPRSRSELLVLVAVVTFFMSSVLDNLTTTIVMVSLLQKLCPDPETRKLLGGVVVVAANAGGAWTPIGDVTTTMLWIHGQISPLPTMQSLLLPSAVSVALPVAAWAAALREEDAKLAAASGTGAGAADAASRSAGQASTSAATAAASAIVSAPGGLPPAAAEESAPPRGTLVLSAGLGCLLFVPVFKAWAGLPPYMGMLAGLGFLWLLTDALHLGEQRRSLTVSQALKRIDSEGVLFFTGVLMAVGALDKAGILREAAEALSSVVPDVDLVAALIGLASAVVDNVPLVAATMAMYDMGTYPLDDRLWQLIAYCAGTGGSLLVIGSAAGVAYMGMCEGVGFGWYARAITPWAAAGYFAGIGTYVAQSYLPALLPAA